MALQSVSAVGGGAPRRRKPRSQRVQTAYRITSLAGLEASRLSDQPVLHRDDAGSPSLSV